MRSGRVVRKWGEREKGSHVEEVSTRHVKMLRQARLSIKIGKAARSNGSHIKSELKMEPHSVFFKEVTKQCTNKDHNRSVATASEHLHAQYALGQRIGRPLLEQYGTAAAGRARQDPHR